MRPYLDKGRRARHFPGVNLRKCGRNPPSGTQTGIHFKAIQQVGVVPALQIDNIDAADTIPPDNITTAAASITTPSNWIGPPALC